ncbi:hypothetical protein [Mycolicibacterium fortuitum]|uniref:hypothetical protein n=1 Tax=Mycolicibacterium fortuitum TaxID=1766 RepID=UPI001CDB9BA8|nr:hypothetical protein [Mycolicibacterium fortuitum]UBV13023.1 hypothetical protein H8Z57_19305 [Mycolicibacterium fortuitum]
MVELGNVVKTANGAIGAVVDWLDHGMRPGIFTIEWDETTFTGDAPPRHWTRVESEALTILS